MTPPAQSTATPPKENVFRRAGKAVGRFFAKIGKGIANYFRPVGQALVHGDIWTKLSFLVSGLGYFCHGREQEIYGHEVVQDENGRSASVVTKSTHYVTQWLRGFFYLAIEAIAILVLVFWGIPNFAKLSLQNLAVCTLDPETFEEVCPPGGADNSFLIVLLSVISILVLIAFFFLHISAIKGVYRSEVDIKENRPIKTARQDVHALFDEHFYITTLVLPIIGILVFTLVPTLVMILIAFTNYGGKDAAGQTVDINNFSWVGWTNWSNLFSIGGGSSFLMVFGQQLLWTLIWAFFATITCFFGGLLLALLLNSKRTRLTKVWRTGFVLTIAVPQFVTLMLIRYFLDDNGIVNNLLVEKWHLISQPIGFLTDPMTTKFTIILVNCWVGFPYLMLMISGILMNIPSDLYESARLDGASRSRMFFSITMPYILQVCTPYLISSFVSNINNFNVIYLLTMGGASSNQAYIDVNARESDLLITWLYNMIAGGAKHEYYMASIVGIIMFTISTLFTLITFTQTTKGDRERRLG